MRGRWGDRDRGALAKRHAQAHISRMASASHTLLGKSPSKAPARMRSALTGRYVLAPASKQGRITIAMARHAASALHGAKK